MYALWSEDRAAFQTSHSTAAAASVVSTYPAAAVTDSNSNLATGSNDRSGSGMSATTSANTNRRSHHVALGADAATAALQQDVNSLAHSNDQGLNNFVHGYESRDAIAECVSSAADTSKGDDGGCTSVFVNSNKQQIGK